MLDIYGICDRAFNIFVILCLSLSGTITSKPSPQTIRLHMPLPQLAVVIQVAQLSQRCRAAGWVSYGQKWEDWNWETIFTDIISLYSTTVTYLVSNAIDSVKTQKELLRRSRSFKVIEVGINRKPVCDFLLVFSSN